MKLVPSSPNGWKSRRSGQKDRLSWSSKEAALLSLLEEKSRRPRDKEGDSPGTTQEGHAVAA